MLHNQTHEQFRLTLTIEDREVVFDAPLFSNFRHAQSSVARAVRHHAGRGRITRVTLQRTRRQSTRRRTTAAPPTDTWSTECHWGRDVIDRILAQTGHTHPPDNESRTATPDAPLSRSDGPGPATQMPLLLGSAPATTSTRCPHTEEKPGEGPVATPLPLTKKPGRGHDHQQSLPAPRPNLRGVLHKRSEWLYAATIAFIAIIYIGVIAFLGNFHALSILERGYEPDTCEIPAKPAEFDSAHPAAAAARPENKSAARREALGSATAADQQPYVRPVSDTDAPAASASTGAGT